MLAVAARGAPPRHATSWLLFYRKLLLCWESWRSMKAYEGHAGMPLDICIICSSNLSSYTVASA